MVFYTSKQFLNCILGRGGQDMKEAAVAAVPMWKNLRAIRKLLLDAQAQSIETVRTVYRVKQ